MVAWISINTIYRTLYVNTKCFSLSIILALSQSIGCSTCAAIAVDILPCLIAYLCSRILCACKFLPVPHNTYYVLPSRKSWEDIRVQYGLWYWTHSFRSIHVMKYLQSVVDCSEKDTVSVGISDVALKDHRNTVFLLHKLPLQQQ